MPFLKLDNSKAVILTNKLEKMQKHDLPLAVRGTLNSLAFDVKQKTMPVSADKHMEKRKPNFFKANSRVEMAKGIEVTSMKAVVGFIHTNAQYNNFAVKELEQQEFGGMIPKRTFVPLDQARVGNANKGQVQRKSRLSQINKIINSRTVRGSSRKQRYLKAAVMAGKGGHIVAGIGKELLYRINSIKRIGGRTVINSTPIYSYSRGRSVKIDSTRFIMEAVNNTTRKTYSFYEKEAMRRFAMK